MLFRSQLLDRHPHAQHVGGHPDASAHAGGEHHREHGLVVRAGGQQDLLRAQAAGQAGGVHEQAGADAGDQVRSQQIAAAYRDAAKGDTASEANLRRAWWLTRQGNAQEAIAILAVDSSSSPDPYLRYTYSLVRGHALRALGRLDDADAAYRQALTLSPGAQSARIALMTLMTARGRLDEAATFADAVQTTRDQADPWWTYTRGDGRMITALLAKVREATR